jgi:hypothetical protein
LAEGEGDVRKMSCNVCGSNSEIWKYVRKILMKTELVNPKV